jgi:cell division protein FtsB
MSADGLTQAVVAQQLARVTLRAHAAEMMLYSLNDALQAMKADVDRLAQDVAQAAQKIHDLNDKYPLGDGTPEQTRDMLIKALRASVPVMASKSDAEIAAAYNL